MSNINLKHINRDKVIIYQLNKREILHMIRVGEYTLKIAEELGIENIELIHTSGRLHDIGKALIDPMILNKPCKLTDNEYEYIKAHVIFSAYEALNKGYSMCIVNNILFHHENFDGTGYFGLKGEDIPIGARIIRVADVFDALTMNRPYRTALTKDKALAIMETEKNKYDPEIFSIFKKLLKKGEF